MNIAIVDLDLIYAPGNQLLNGLEPSLAYKNLALLRGVRSRNKIDLRVKYRNGGPLHAVGNLRPLKEMFQRGE